MQGIMGRLVGFVVGAIAGIALALIFGESIGRAFGVSNFEGRRGYFVFLTVIPLFAIVGSVLGAIMIAQGWRFNLSVLAILFVVASGFVFYHRTIFLGFPYQTEKIGNFTIETFDEDLSADTYGLRYANKSFDVEEHAGKSERNRRIRTMVLITSTAANSTPPLFLIMAGHYSEDRHFYLVGEREGVPFSTYLCDTTLESVDSLDNQPAIDLSTAAESQWRDKYLQRKEISGSRWLLLGDACVFDLQNEKAYPFTPVKARDSVDPQVNQDHLPVALSPDMRSIVRIVTLDEYDASGNTHLGKSLHLFVNNFVEDSSYSIEIDRTRMRYTPIINNSFSADDIDRQWLDHHFEWQKGADGNDRLVERSSFTPWAHRGWLSGYYNDLSFRLDSVKPELMDKLEEFLAANFGAKRIKREHSDESGSIYTSLELQIDDKVINASFQSDEYSDPSLSFWHSAATTEDNAPTAELMKKIAQAINEALQSGAYDEYFVFKQYS